MRKQIDKQLLRAFLTRLDESLDRPGVVFLLGGSSLVWRDIKKYSMDIDLALAGDEPDPIVLLDAIDRAQDFIETTVDIIRMGETMPLPDDFGSRAEKVEDLNLRFLTVRHFDPYSIALTKLNRSEQRDFSDVGAMVGSGLIDCAELRHHAESVAKRFPRGTSRPDKDDFRRKVDGFIRQFCE